MATTAASGDGEVVGTRFLEALSQQDWTALDACFDPDVHFRALIPHGLREATDHAAATSYLRQWFGDATALRLIASAIESVQDRLSIRYRFEAYEGAWYVGEQQAYCDVVAGHITRMEVLCSGFRPLPS